MSYPVRNTLIIAAVWTILIALGFYYVFGVQMQAEKRLTAEVELKNSRVDDLQSLYSDRTQLEKEYARLQELNSGKKGFIASHETPGETFDYIQRELERVRSSLTVNLSLNSTDQFAGVSKRKYEIFGTGRFVDLYHLIWFLESGPLFYSIQSVKLERTPALEGRPMEKGLVRFSLQVDSYNRPEGPKIAEISSENTGVTSVAELVTNRIVKTVAPAAESAGTAPVALAEARVTEQLNRENLPEISNGSVVMAVTTHGALVRDNHGKMIRLRTGDRVHLGRVREVNAQMGRVVIDIENRNRPTQITLTTKQN
jgi:hypothetical protein